MTEHGRTDPPLVGDEKATLAGFLDYQRQTLEWKCTGLSPDQLAARASAPSTLSLLGLVRHMVEVEYGWFDLVDTGTRRPPRFYDEADHDGDFNGAVADQGTVDEAFAAWREAVTFAQDVVARHDLSDTFVHPRSNETFSLRWVLAHMLEEYARHNGHADLLREAIDGEVGE